VRGQSAVHFPREGSYIGTMIDDLITKDLREPYRVLTSRSEYRLVLRGDNADRRLTPMGRELGLIDDRRWEIYNRKQEAIEAEKHRLETVRLKGSDPAAPAVEAATGAPIRGSITLADLLRRSGFHSDDLVQHGLADAELPADVREGAEIDIKYSGYLARQQQQIDRVRKQAHQPIPADVNYAAIGTLSKEARERLAAVQPLSLGQASRVPGVSPADITALMLWLEIRRRQDSSTPERVSTVNPTT
jgi:tRNA uridine 5-carboxymethylaminomethyl modification enzyme